MPSRALLRKPICTLLTEKANAPHNDDCYMARSIFHSFNNLRESILYGIKNALSRSPKKAVMFFVDEKFKRSEQ